MFRQYVEKLDNSFFGELFTVEEWLNDVKDKLCSNDDGVGYWVKDGYESDAEVFSSKPEDATHVAWYNK